MHFDYNLIAHFRVHLSLSIKARPGAQPFRWKWVKFVSEWNLIFIWKDEHQGLLWGRGLKKFGKGLFQSRLRRSRIVSRSAREYGGSVALPLKNPAPATQARICCIRTFPKTLVYLCQTELETRGYVIPKFNTRSLRPEVQPLTLSIYNHSNKPMRGPDLRRPWK